MVYIIYIIKIYVQYKPYNGLFKKFLNNLIILNNRY